MDQLNINKLLHREKEEAEMKHILSEFEANKHNLLFRKGIYIYGGPGSGKTTFVANILKQLNYDIVKYDAGDIRNTSVIEDITKHNMSDKNIMSLFHKHVQKIAVIMDEIDGMNNGDKGGINSLIKLIRPKKTKKQKLEEITMNPIICIGNYKVDKKIKELMKVCYTIELSTPTSTQMHEIVQELMPDIGGPTTSKLVTYVQGDLRKLHNIYRLHSNRRELFTEETDVLEKIFQIKSYNDDTKKVTSKLMREYYPIQEHNHIMNETDRTSVGLLWHENIIDAIEQDDKRESIPFYLAQLDNICYADYIDRITFQKQIWQFNEMSSLIKTFRNNKLFHEYRTRMSKPRVGNGDVRFTKVLTKYSTEYNNSLFVQKLCQKLAMDKKDMFGFFIELSNNHCPAETMSQLDNFEISKLDVNRIYRYIEKYVKENASGTADREIDDEDTEDFEE